MKRRLFTILSALSLLLFVAFLFRDRSNWSKAVVRESEAIGNTIVHALESYKAEHGRYPVSLDGLVPKYLREIAPPTAGQRMWYYYASSDGQDFLLAFEAVDVEDGGPSASWKPGYTRWGHDTGFP